jgi:hypothetical protein
MKLAAIDEAEIPRAKIVLYLLNPNHHAGKAKRGSSHVMD